jgi:hypothetical protein
MLSSTRGTAVTEKTAIATLALVFSACAGLIVPQPATNQTVGWLLRVGPQGANQRVACASDSSAPCVLEAAPQGKRIEATLVVYLPPGTNRHFNGEAFATFIGADEGPTGYTMKIDQDVPNKGYPQVSVTGIVTSAPGNHRIRITLDESGQELHEPLRHVIDVPVQVR